MQFYNEDLIYQIKHIHYVISINSMILIILLNSVDHVTYVSIVNYVNSIDWAYLSFYRNKSLKLK